MVQEGEEGEEGEGSECVYLVFTLDTVKVPCLVPSAELIVLQ